MLSAAKLRVLGPLLTVLLMGYVTVHASQSMKLQPAPIDSDDIASLQNGAKLFVNYCLGCHSAGYMRYNRLRDLGLTEQQIRDNLIFTGVKVGELMLTSMDRKDAKEWFGVAPPDLTVIARSRSSKSGSGADWLYAYLRAFYRDPSRPAGWNNLVFENVGMPHVLWELNGAQKLVVQEFKSAHDAHAAFITLKSVARIDEVVTMADGKESRVYKLKSLEAGKGTLTGLEYDRQIADLVNYMSYMAEPMRLDRRRIGMYVLLFLGVLLVFAFALKKAYWKDVH